tara:strand:- start:32 stop:205 length:174 start_codon:yes stop_codon:yes gene_type:complete
MNITQAKYITDMNGDNDGIEIMVDGKKCFISESLENRYYVELKELVDAGKLTIQEAD